MSLRPSVMSATCAVAARGALANTGADACAGTSAPTQGVLRSVTAPCFGALFLEPLGFLRSVPFAVRVVDFRTQSTTLRAYLSGGSPCAQFALARGPRTTIPWVPAPSSC